MGLLWALAFFLSLGLRLWGFQHPEPFLIRPFLIWTLLLAPSVLLSVWLFIFGFNKKQI